jgi:tetratricopeptide (TPR) repeat protein
MKKLKVSVIVASVCLAGPAFADQKLDAAVAKAEEQLQKGRPDEALKAMQKLVDQSPGNLDALLAQARIQERTGPEGIDAAAATLSKAAGMSFADPAQKADALAAQASFALGYGSSADAFKEAEAAVAAKPTVAALSVMARSQARVRDGVLALETADKAVAAGPTSSLAQEARGDALLAMVKFDDAVTAFRKAVEFDQKSIRARVGLARALFLNGKAGEAVVEARKATEMDQKSGDAFAALGMALVLDNPNNWNDAIAQAVNGSFLAPKSSFANMMKGRIYDIRGDVDQAMNSYRMVLENDPAHTSARVALINDQSRKGDNDGALAEAKKLVADRPDSAEGQLLLGRALMRKNDFAAAMPALEKVVKLAPGQAEAHALLGTTYQFNRRTEEALAEYKKAVELAPTKLDYRTTYGLLLGLVGQYDVGVAELQKVVSNPAYKDDDAWINLGWVYRNMTPPKIEESVAAYKKALQINPKSEQSALGMGWAYSYGKNWDGSIAAFEQAIKIEPKTAGEAHDGMAWAYFFKKDLPKAKESMERAKSEGRPDSKLGVNIERMEKILAHPGASSADQEKAAADAAAAYEEQRKMQAKVDRLNNQLRSNSAADRRRGAADIAGLLGPQDSLPYLIRFLQDPDWGVREAAVNAIKNMACAAKISVPYLKAIINAPKNDSLQMTKDEMQELMHDEDLRRSAREAIAKIEACK